MLNDYSVSAIERIVAYIIARHPGLGLNTDYFQLSKPTRVQHDGKNTELTVTYRGAFVSLPTYVMHYNRQDLEAFFNARFNELSLSISNITTAHEALAAVMEKYNIALEPGDIVDQSVGQDSVTLKASPDSYGWIGTVTFSLASSNFQLDDGTPLILDNGDYFELD